MHRTVRVCQYQTCRQQGATSVLNAFKKYTSPEISVEPSACLGQCGSGPMVLILPEETWYWHLSPSDVPIIVEQHLRGGQVVLERLYPRFHHAHKSFAIWLAVGGLGLCLIILLLWIQSTPGLR